jgi:hypothetical protein
LARPLDGGAEADRFAVLRDGAAGDVEALGAEQIDELVVGEDRVGLSAAISARMWLFTASADTASPPSDDWIPLVKKNLSSNSPRSQDRYLFDVTRLTVDSCMPIASATWRRVRGRSCETPWRKKPSCCFTISVATLMMVLARWSSALVSQLALARHSDSQLWTCDPARRRRARGSSCG